MIITDHDNNVDVNSPVLLVCTCIFGMDLMHSFKKEAPGQNNVSADAYFYLKAEIFQQLYTINMKCCHQNYDTNEIIFVYCHFHSHHHHQIGFAPKCWWSI